MFKTIITFPDEIKERIEKICKDIASKDKSFIYSFNNNNIVIETETEKRGWAIGFWFKQKGNYREDLNENKMFRRKIKFTVVKC